MKAIFQTTAHCIVLIAVFIAGSAPLTAEEPGASGLVASAVNSSSVQAPLADPDPTLRQGIPPAAPAPTDWYAGYSAETFGKLPAAQQKLDRQALDFDLLNAAIFHATNGARKSQGLRPLIHLPGLTSAACEHSMAMVTRGFFSHHNAHDPTRATPSMRVEAQGVQNMAVGENICRGTGTGHTYWSYARYVVRQWMNSPGHRANILWTNYTHLGCGAHACGCPGFHMLATQNFAFVIPHRSTNHLAPPPRINAPAREPIAAR